jgi:hypothetical protein
MRHWRLLTWVVALGTAACIGGCGGSSDPAGTASAPTSAGTGEATPGYLTGRVTMGNGTPVTASDVKYRLTISGVSGPGERVDFTPIVKPDGSFSQKLPDGIYHMPYGTLTVRFENQLYSLPLEAVDPTGDRESPPGIVQNFVWKLTGPKPDRNLDVNNATHWYGITIPVRFSTWRDDIGKAPPDPPAGSKVIYTLKPLSTLVDGSPAQPLTIERAWRAGDITPTDSLNDLPPANYEITGVLQLADGSSKPLLLQGKGDYPAFKPSIRLIIEPYENAGAYFVPPMSWVTD